MPASVSSSLSHPKLYQTNCSLFSQHWCRVSINPKEQLCDLFWVKSLLFADPVLVFMATWSQKIQWFSPEELANYTDKRAVRGEVEWKSEGVRKITAKLIDHFWRGGEEGLKDCKENTHMERRGRVRVQKSQEK